MEVNEARRLKELEDENRRLKHMVADLSLDKDDPKPENEKLEVGDGRPNVVLWTEAEGGQMPRKRHTDEQIKYASRQAEAPRKRACFWQLYLGLSAIFVQVSGLSCLKQFHHEVS